MKLTSPKQTLVVFLVLRVLKKYLITKKSIASDAKSIKRCLNTSNFQVLPSIQLKQSTNLPSFKNIKVLFVKTGVLFVKTDVLFAKRSPFREKESFSHLSVTAFVVAVHEASRHLCFVQITNRTFISNQDVSARAK